jgi:hypothetical protein
VLCPDEPLDDERILVTLILNKKRMPGFVDQTYNAIAAIRIAPDQM